MRVPLSQSASASLSIFDGRNPTCYFDFSLSARCSVTDGCPPRLHADVCEGADDGYAHG